MAEYQGKKVTLNRPRAIRKGEPGYGKKRKVVFVSKCSSDGNRIKRIIIFLNCFIKINSI